MKTKAFVVGSSIIAFAAALPQSRDFDVRPRDSNAAQKIPEVSGFSNDLNNKISSGFQDALKFSVDVTNGYSGPNEIDGIPLVYANNTGAKKTLGGLEAFKETSLYKNAPSKEDVASGKVTKVSVTQEDVNILNTAGPYNIPVYYSEIPVGDNSMAPRPILAKPLEHPDTGCCSLTQEQQNQQEALTQREKSDKQGLFHDFKQLASGRNKSVKVQEKRQGRTLLGDVSLIDSTLQSPFFDAFYHPLQAVLNDVRNGFPISYRLMAHNNLTLPQDGLRAYQTVFRTENTGSSQALGAVATIFVPKSSPNPGFTMGIAFHENAANLACSLSYMWALGRADQSLGEWINRGWVIVAPDHEGPNSAFLASILGAHIMLDALRATKNIASLIDITTPNRVGLYGYSAGSTIVATAARLIPSYAPEFAPGGPSPVIAVGLGGFIVDLVRTYSYINKSMWTAMIALGLIGLGTEYPRLANRVTSQLNNTLEEAHYYSTYLGCAEVQVVSYYFQDVNSLFKNQGSGIIGVDWVDNILSANSAYGSPINVPIYIDQSSGDEVASTPDVENIIQQWCSAGRQVTYHRNPNRLAHLAQEPLSTTSAMNFLSDVVNNRFSQGACGVPLANAL